MPSIKVPDTFIDLVVALPKISVADSDVTAPDPLSVEGQNALNELMQLNGFVRQGKDGLTVRCGNNFTDAGMAKLEHWPNIVHAELFGAHITAAGLRHLQRMTHLRNLILQSATIDDAGLACIAESCPDLEAINLEDTRVTDDGLSNLVRLRSLVSLDLSRNHQLTDRGLASLPQLTSLRNLNLSETGITDLGLAQLGTLKNLRELQLMDTGVTDAGISNIAKLSNLEKLELSMTAVTDQGVLKLRDLASLQVLGLEMSAITDKSLLEIEELGALRQVSVRFTKVSGNAITGFQRARPDIRVISTAGMP